MPKNIEILDEVEEFIDRFPDASIFDVIEHINFVFKLHVSVPAADPLSRAVFEVSQGGDPVVVERFWL